MMAGVIQGFFPGGRARVPGPAAAPPPPPTTTALPRALQARPGARSPGPPSPAFAGRAPVAQPRGAGDAFAVDPSRLGVSGGGGGRPLPDGVRGDMERALGADFSAVRVHVGPQAERIGAEAFTMGADIYFAPGRFQPETARGRQLLGHELAHVAQQRAGRVRNPFGGGLAVVQDRALEAEAERLGNLAAARFSPRGRQMSGVGAGRNAASAPGRGAVAGAISPFIQAKLSYSVTDAVLQGDYMSGDRYTLASALRLNTRLGVIIISGDAMNGQELKQFYEQSAGAKGRVEIFDANNTKYSSREWYRYLTQIEKINDYQQRTQRKNEGDYKGFRDACLINQNTRLWSASKGTKEVGDSFGRNWRKTRGELHKLWSYKGNQWDLEYFLVGELGFNKSKKYAFLWCKTGRPSAEKSHHFTSIAMWRRLKSLIEQNTDFTPVFVGDDIGLKSSPSLVKFWNHQYWKWAIGEGDTRREQLALWALIARIFGKNAVNIGMRSGAIEVPALLGIRTLYLEEAGNAQAERMEKWIGKVPGFERLVLGRPVGLNQVIAWGRDVRKFGRDTQTYKRSTGYFARLANLRLGSDLDQIKGRVDVAPRNDFRTGDRRNRQTTFTTFRGINIGSIKTSMPVLRARESLIEQIKRASITVEDFYPNQDELEWIIKWIKK